jgi:hypothetical protein
VRSLKFLKSHNSPWPPPCSSSSAFPLPRDCTAAGRRAAPPEASHCSSAAPCVTPELARRLSSSLLALPKHATMPYRPPELPSLCRRRPPPLIVTAALPVPFSTTLAPRLWFSSERATPPRLCPSAARPPRCAADRQQQLLRAVPLLNPTA